MRRLTFVLFLLSCQGAAQHSSTRPLAAVDETPPTAQDTAADSILAEDMRAHVELLASDAYEGRETLTPGYEMAATYMAEQFAAYGLAPMPGQDSFAVEYRLWQHSYDPEGTRLALRSAAGEKVVALGMDGTPFGFSDEGELDAEVVFAGYGITAPELGHDDYKGLNVKGKWVLVLRHAPGYLDESSAFFSGVRKDKTTPEPKATPKVAGNAPAKAAAEPPPPSSYSAFTSKAMNAQEHGAKGMLLVSGPLTAQMPDDLRMPERLELPKTEAEKLEMERKQAERKQAFEAMAAERAAQSKAEGTKSKKTVKNNSKKPAPEKTLLAFHIAPSHAADLIANTRMSLVELQTAVDAGAPARKFKLKAHAGASVKERKEPATVAAKNVIGYLEGSDPQLKDEFVVIGGHFDHLGRLAAHHAEGADAKDTIFNGADDNASGTAGVLELAQAFSSSAHRPRRSLLFMGFSAEEKGLLGARALVKQGPLDTSKVAFMLNLDMIGRNSKDDIEFVGGDFATKVREIAEVANKDLRLGLAFGPYAPNSDHHAFFEREIPVAFFFSGTHEDYHQLSDHADKLDYPRMQAIVRLAYALARDVAQLDERPVFIHKLSWLGASIQRVGDNAQFTAVEADSRASRAGIAVGDVLTKIGERALALGMSLDESSGEKQSAGKLLSEIPPGQSTALHIERAGKRQQLTIVRAKRGYLGIIPGRLSDDDRQKYSVDNSEGVLIDRTGPEAPAYESGLRDGDIITKLAGHSVNNATLMGVLSRIGAGESITVQIIRAGKRIEMPLTLGEPPTR